MRSDPGPRGDDAEGSDPSPPTTIVRALSVAAWPLAVAGPLVIWDVGISIVAALAPEVVLDGGCTEPWGSCAAPMADVVADVGRVGRAPVVMLGAALGLAVLRGVPARRRPVAALVVLGFEAALAALVGIAALRIGTELR